MPPRLFHPLLDLLFPPNCVLCQLNECELDGLCETCLNKLSRIEEPFCPRCGEAIDGAITHARRCPNCRNSPKPYDFARAAFRSTGEARDLVHRFKYKREFHLGRTLGSLAAETYRIDPRFREQEGWVLIPVPLHATKQRKRSFNQAAEIARQTSRITGMQTIDALKRIRATNTQTKLSRRQRQLNLHQAFQLRPRCLSALQGRPLLIIDDVFTTGSTVEECARTLRRALRPPAIAVLTPLRA